MTGATAAEHVAYTGASAAFEAMLRERHFGHRGVAYAGRSFRVYPSMSVGDAVRFYGAINPEWQLERLEADLALVSLGENFEVRRLKRAYQRSLVLAFAAATSPELLVVEGAEEFDDERTEALLARVLGRVPRSYATYAAGVTHPSEPAGRAVAAVLP